MSVYYTLIRFPGAPGGRTFYTFYKVKVQNSHGSVKFFFENVFLS